QHHEFKRIHPVRASHHDEPLRRVTEGAISRYPAATTTAAGTMMASRRRSARSWAAPRASHAAQRASKSGSRLDCSAIRPSQAQGFGEGSAGTAVDSKKREVEVYAL